MSRGKEVKKLREKNIQIGYKNYITSIAKKICLLSDYLLINNQIVSILKH